MAADVYISRLGNVLRERQLAVSELQRRLWQRGHSISRGALDRLMSERPVRTVDLEILVPLLEELDVDFHAAFEHVPCAVAEAHVAAYPVARQAAQQVAHRHALAAADAELKRAVEHLEDELRQAHPELFDARGRLKQRALERLLVERSGGNDILEGDALATLLALEEPPRRPDAA